MLRKTIVRFIIFSAAWFSFWIICTTIFFNYIHYMGATYWSLGVWGFPVVAVIYILVDVRLRIRRSRGRIAPGAPYLVSKQAVIVNSVTPFFALPYTPQSRSFIKFAHWFRSKTLKCQYQLQFNKPLTCLPCFYTFHCCFRCLRVSTQRLKREAGEFSL